MKGLVRRTPYGFEPSDEDGWKIHKGMAVGALCRVEYKKKRCYQNSKRYFAFINTIFDMQEWYGIKENMRKFVQIAAGHYTQFIKPDGTLVIVPKSVDFDSLDEIEFRQVFHECITAVLETKMQDGSPFLGDITEEQLLSILQFD